MLPTRAKLHDDKLRTFLSFDFFFARDQEYPRYFPGSSRDSPPRNNSTRETNTNECDPRGGVVPGFVDPDHFTPDEKVTETGFMSQLAMVSRNIEALLRERDA